MKPIAQSFLISVPDSVAEGVFLSSISVYFQSVSNTFGISMEIRTVENGFPTVNVLAGGRSRVSASEAVASKTASSATVFTFDSIPFLRTNTQYAFVLIPDGGNEDYTVWSGKIGDKDVSTNSPIYTSNQLGNLFISSNDLVWTPIVSESMKYELNIANFATTSADVYLRPADTDFIRIDSRVGIFYDKETVWVSNSEYSYAQTVADSSIVTVPNSTISDLTTNNWIYIATPDRRYIQFKQVVSAPNSTTIDVGSNLIFTNTMCIFGRVAGDGKLNAVLKTQSRYSIQEDLELVLESAYVNSTINFTGTTGKYIFGLGSRASAVITDVANKQYDSVTPQINFIQPTSTNIKFSYRGYSNSGIQDSSYIDATTNVPNEFIDTERLIYSKSNEVSNNFIGSNASFTVRAQLSTGGNIVAPYIDRLGTNITFTYNAPAAQTQLMGYYLNLDDVTGKFNAGDIITQGSVTGVVDAANNSYIRINLPSGKFTNTSITDTTSGATANVTTSTYFDETLNNGYYKASRYISKNVILADKQDAEDLISYLTIHRPVGTQFNVYAKFLNGLDTESFNDKDWSYMPEFDSTVALFSSAANKDDVIEAQFGLPTTIILDTDTGVTNTSIANVTVLDTTFYSSNTFVYLKDNVSGSFNVRKIESIPDNFTLSLSSVPSFSSTNTSVGVIPGLQSQSGAFLYANNNGILRYVTSDDVVYDSYKTFAIKIVPVSNNSVLVPTMKNMRSLALQI